MKALWIGDMHFRVSDLQDADSIVNQLIALIDQEKPDMVILAGDQFDSFGVIRSEILAIWSKFFIEAGKRTEIVALVGNHDMAGADGGVSAMEAFKAYPNITIVDAPMQIGPATFFPFFRDNDQFAHHCNLVSEDTILFCHQSFNGAQFENGFYDPHGADPRCVKHLKAVISGHVHKAQQFQNIIYPGTPRQLTFSDAGENKAVFTITLDRSSYNIEKAHVLDVPQFLVYEAPTTVELLSMVKSLNKLKTDFSKSHVKFVAKGTPAEIAQFWQEPEVVEFKLKAKRVVDALTSMKPITAFVAVKGQTQSEKLISYINERSWRTEKDSLIQRAAGLLN